MDNPPLTETLSDFIVRAATSSPDGGTSVIAIKRELHKALEPVTYLLQKHPEVAFSIKNVYATGEFSGNLYRALLATAMQKEVIPLMLEECLEPLLKPLNEEKGLMIDARTGIQRVRDLYKA